MAATVVGVKQTIRRVADNEDVMGDTLVFLRDHYPSAIQEDKEDVVVKLETLDGPALEIVQKYVTLSEFRHYLEKLETENPPQYERIVSLVKANYPDTAGEDDTLDIATLPLDFVRDTMKSDVAKEEKRKDVSKDEKRNNISKDEKRKDPSNHGTQNGYSLKKEGQKDVASNNEKQKDTILRDVISKGIISKDAISKDVKTQKHIPSKAPRAATEDDIEAQEDKVYGVLELLREELKKLAEIKALYRLSYEDSE